MKIVSLQTENVKKIKAVTITPKGNMVVVGGKNEAGKTAVMDSIEMALAGAGAIPPVPVRRGESKAKVTLDLGDMIVTRTFTSDGGTSLVITNKDGLKFPSPQSMLDALVGRISFDVFEFARQKPEQQAASLKLIVGLDFTKQKQEREKKFSERTIVNRDAKSIEARIAALPTPLAGIPAEEQSSESILAEQRAASESNAKNQEVRNAEQSAKLAKEGKFSFISITKFQIEKIKTEIAALQNELTKQEKVLVEVQDDYRMANDHHAMLAEQAGRLQDIDLSQFTQKLAKVEEQNKHVRSNKQRTTLGNELADKLQQSINLTEEIEGIDAEITKTIAETKFPIDGLSVSESGEVMFQGLPFSQASSSSKTRVSVAIGAALNPKLRVLMIRDGSLLDDDSMALVASLAEEKDMQLWIERVGTDGNVTVIIEDGMVKAVGVAEESK